MELRRHGVIGTSLTIEAVNRVIDDVHRAGRGYSFDVIRGKLLLSPELQKKTFRPKKPRKARPPTGPIISANRTGVAVPMMEAVNAKLGADLDLIGALLDQDTFWDAEDFVSYTRDGQTLIRLPATDL